MPLNKLRLVDIPPHTARQKVGEKTYIYLRTEYYRNAQGNSTQKRLAIGRLDESTGKLIPNRNYFEHFEADSFAVPLKIRNAGTLAVANHVAKTTGLTDILQKSFPDNYKEILTLAQYLLYGNSTMYYVEDWLEEELSFYTGKLSSSQISTLFQNIVENKKDDFFINWMKNRSKKEFIAYDVSSISTYSTGIRNAEWGYNRDKEKLPQINLAMFYGQDSMLPFYYRVYPGSITDKTHLSYMMKDMDDINHKHGYYVMDRGFFTDDNLKELTNKGCRFVIAVPAHLNFYEDMVEKHKSEIIARSSCKLGSNLPYAKTYESTKYGFRMNVHIYYDDKKVSIESDSFLRKIDDLETALGKMKELPSKTSNYCKYFKIKQLRDKLIFERNNDAIDKDLSYCGFFMIADTTFKMDAKQALDNYRQRDCVEKCFDNLKNETDLKRLGTHSDETTDGKMFITFISLIIRASMTKMLGTYIRENNFTFHKIILELSKIKVKYDPSAANQFRLLNPLTKKQKEILEALGINPNNFENLCVV